MAAADDLAAAAGREPATVREERYRQAERALWQHVGLVPTERFVTLPRTGTTVRVQEVGDGPAVLFVHGSPNSGTTWAPIVPHLRGLHAILLDRPGTGLSDAVRIPKGAEAAFVETLLIDVFDALAIERADLVGSSFGGYLGLVTAALHPERIRRMVQMGIPGPVLDAPVAPFVRLLGIPGIARLLGALPPNRRAGPMMLRQIGHGASLDAGRIPTELFGWSFALGRDTGTMREELAFMRRVVTVRGFVPEVRLDEEFLAQVRTPTHVLWGTDDAFGDEGLARRLVAAMPDARLDVLPGGGHLPWLDDPSRAGRLVSDALSR